MSERQYTEKEEKQEKEEEKEEKEEKSWDEKWQRDPLSAAVWAGILVWAGIVLLVDNLGFLARFELLDAWGLIFVGAALLLLLEVAARLVLPTYRRPVTGTIVFAIILLAIGLGNLVGWELVWPLVLIVIGLSIAVRGLFWRR